MTYASEADNLDPLDTNVVYGDIYRTANPMVGSDDTTWVYNAALFITNLVSVNFAGTPGNGPSYSPSINFDGSQIAYASEATNLDPFVPDTNFRRDIFLYDLSSAVGGLGTFGTTQRISMDREMGEANESSYVPIVAPGGSQVVFVSEASDLVWNDRNYVYDVFAYDGTVDRPVFLKIIGNTVPVDIGGTADVVKRLSAP